MRRGKALEGEPSTASNIFPSHGIWRFCASHDRCEAGGILTAIRGWVPKVGIGAWSFVGFVVALSIVVGALSAVSEIVLPLTFAAVLAVVFQPMVQNLQRHKLKPTYAAGLVVLGLLALMTVVLVATVQGVTEQTDQISASVNAAIKEASDSLSVDQATLDSARDSIEGAGPTIGEGFLTQLVEGFNKAAGTGERAHPRRSDHVLPAQGRYSVPPLDRRAARLSAP